MDADLAMENDALREPIEKALKPTERRQVVGWLVKERSLPAERVTRLLDPLKDSHSLPQQIRADNGPEFITSKLVAW